jgi:siroheme synthase (precorrin-2 oxidase/ferrochelatase)
MELQAQLQAAGLLVVVEEELIHPHLQQDQLAGLVVEELVVIKIQEMQEKELLEQPTLVVVAVDVGGI